MQKLTTNETLNLLNAKPIKLNNAIYWAYEKNLFNNK